MPNAKAKANKRQDAASEISSTLTALLTVCNTASSNRETLLTKHRRLQTLLATLKKLQSPSTIIPRRTPAALATLLRRYTPNAGFKACFTDAENTNATLITTRVIQEGECIVKIGVKDALLDELPACLEVLNKYLPMSQDASLRLALNLLHQSRLPDSAYREYIQGLPESFENLLSFDTTVVGQLPEGLLGTAVRVLSTRIRVYCMVYQTLSRLGHEYRAVLSWVNYAWASGVVMSRQNRVGEGLGLVPVWDMIDHSCDAGVSEVVEEGDASYVVLRGGMGAGERVTMNYGPRGNGELLLYAGFVESGNRADVVEVWVAVEGVLKGVKANVLRRLGVRVDDGAGVRVLVRVGYGAFEAVMRVMRVVVMEKDGLVGVMRDGLPGVGHAAVEKAATALLKRVVEEAVAQNEQLSRTAADERVRVLLDGEKAVLDDLVDKLDGT